ncbi:MAG: hypothetical protein V1875_06505 [Candidatus Altiarchaeota archaeon]
MTKAAESAKHPRFFTPETPVGDIFEFIQEGERRHAERLKPAAGETELRVDLHHHFVPSINPKTRAKQVRAFWKAAEYSGLDAVAITTHSNIGAEDINPGSIYRELAKAMPEALMKRGFRLLAGLEVLCQGRVELGLISSDPDLIYGDGFWMSKPDPLDAAKRISDDDRLLGYLPHPFLNAGGAAHPDNLGLDTAKRLVGDYGLGVELHGFIQDIRDFAQMPGINAILKKQAEKCQHIQEDVHSSGLSRDAEFLTAGGDYHHYKNLGRTFIIVKAKKRSALPLREQFRLSETQSGLVILEACSERLKDDSANTPITDDGLLAGVRSGKRDGARAVLPQSRGMRFLLPLTAEMLREKLGRDREKNLVSEEDRVNPV